MTRDIRKRGELIKEYVMSDGAADKIIALIDSGIDEKMIIDIYIKNRAVTSKTIKGQKVSAKSQFEQYVYSNYKDMLEDAKAAVLDSFG